MQADRMNSIPFSGIRQVFEQVAQRKAQGLSTIPFHIGRPDFDTPDHIKQAAIDAMNAGMTAYTSNYGMPELRQTIAKKLKTENNMVVDPDKQIIVTVGVNEAVFMLMMGLLNPGDEVLAADPMWLHYIHCATLAGAKVVSVPIVESNGFELDPDDIEKRITPKTKMLMINTPNNPTGVVYSEETLRAIADIVEKHGLILVSDEIYEKIIFDGKKHISPASFENITERTITLNGFSKAYAMTGWRLGYVVASPHIISALVRVHQYTTICATSFAQAGAVAALNGPQDDLHIMIEQFDARRKAVMAGCKNIAGVSLIEPKGAFYAFLNISSTGKTSVEIANELMHKAGVAVVPGSAFGQYGEGYIRVAYSCSLDDVQRGMEGIKMVMQKCQR